MPLTQVEMKVSTDINLFYLLQRPWELRRLAVAVQKGMSDEAFISRGGDFEQKVQEALIGSTFSWGGHHIISPASVRMARIHHEALDMEIHSDNGEMHSFEITTLHPADLKIRLAYRDGKRPEIPSRAFSGEPIPAELIASAIDKKTNKIQGKGLCRHLLVYNNVYGGTTDLRRLPRLLNGAERTWDSIWVIAGIPYFGWIALVSNSAGLKAPALEKQLVAKGTPAFWGYWIDPSGFKLFESTGEVKAG
ncbi:MAG: hypothetical protein KGO52_02120 [Nitrospirota bacterium]|nr:hypothetical protein [Nitrospirota bacterium]MDE3241498.1 hypothetical protein [Nitrospirota bacterium]